MPRLPSGYDSALIVACNDVYDVDVSRDQLRRWRGWRGVGLIPRASQRVRGFHLAESISDREVAWIAAAARLGVAFPRSLDRVGLGLSARNYSVSPAAVKEAFIAWFERRVVPGPAEREYRRRSRRRSPDEPALSARLLAEWKAAGLPVDAKEIVRYDHRTEDLKPDALELLEHVTQVQRGEAEPVTPAPETAVAPLALTVKDVRRRLVKATGPGIVYALEVGYARTGAAKVRDDATLDFALWLVAYAQDEDPGFVSSYDAVAGTCAVCGADVYLIDGSSFPAGTALICDRCAAPV